VELRGGGYSLKHDNHSSAVRRSLHPEHSGSCEAVVSNRLVLCMRLSDDWWAAYLDKLNHDTAQVLFRNYNVMGWISIAASFWMAWVLQ
jgi:hypothetical protein